MSWHRLVFENTPVYVHQQSADWFVPNAKADALLQRADGGVEYQRFQARLSSPNPLVYRPQSPTKPFLEEFWIHVTNRCNLTCKHCLFASSPHENDTLTLATLKPLIHEAYDLGCRLFVLSGGEPLVHPEIITLIETILAYAHTEVVILSNGSLVEKIFTCKALPKKRIHFQLSLDGLPEAHDALRGKGSFDKLAYACAWLKKEGYTFSLATCLHTHTPQESDELLALVAQLGATHLHFLWYFSLGRGKDEALLSCETLFDFLKKAYMKAQQLGLVIDNFESLKTQIFAPKGTVHDGSSSGRSSIAIGYDGHFYPSAAMVGEAALRMSGGCLKEALCSDVARAIAQTSISTLHAPLRFLLGGGDFDHSFAHAKRFMGDDPYEPLMEKLALWLITHEAKAFDKKSDAPLMCLEMGDILYSCGANEGVAHTHANCLLATGESESLRLVKRFYDEAALEDNEGILNPVCYEAQYVEHIPSHLRFRGYGCGSPILDAKLTEGEVMLDLGCGRGIECFIASKLVGQSGHVHGVDMLSSMLHIAREGAREVAHVLGYNNLTLTQAYLESLPYDANHFDVITSNCVLNLSSHKRTLFAEIFRVLKEGGRLVVSDVVCDEEASAAIRNDAKLSGECIAGALTQTHLMGLLHESGFLHVELLKRFFYREIEGHLFYSLTFVAYKPRREEYVDVIYKGVAQSLLLADKTLLIKGVKASISHSMAQMLGNEVFILDAKGNVSNQSEQTCACAIAPELDVQEKKVPNVTFTPLRPKEQSNCMVCQSPLHYAPVEHEVVCYYCGSVRHNSVTCEKGHYVCDACHAKEALEIIEHLCSVCVERDMLKLFRTIRTHPSIPKHGPEHHAMVPAIIITAYKNSGGTISENALKTALSRGSSVMGGACGFLGMCGAASGVGIGFAIILESSPISASARSIVQKVTHETLGKIAAYEAARCCNREVWTALCIAASLSETFLHVKLEAGAYFKCDQKKFNQYCYGKKCPIF